ncbi:ABC transporter substrate-binding protein [Deinococcus misasensis]|uniref:ABC transporter substrate-binding protein n=1 Tax=Deinococcus misasensis TaxID=392413 RepID=UPI000554F63D|nr:ABC transporter substrate-binding protein [Deinococcus misasensis]
MNRNTAVRLLSLALLASLTHAHAVNITVDCGSGSGFASCKEDAENWAKKTGNTVTAMQTPNDSSQKLTIFQQQLAAKSADIDVLQIDVVWPGLLGEHLLDLKTYVDPAEIKQHFPSIIRNNTYEGKLVGLPMFTDAGILYYRTDLLKKYGYKSAPKTWADLTAMAKKVQAGERKAGNAKFMGFVFQGKNYEGLTCDALEWVASFGGGQVVEDDGTISINNPKAVNALKTVASWVGTISPAAVVTYGEEDARNVFQAGNALFMRNWPYAYALGQSDGSAVKGKIAVTALPSGPGGTPAATLGGWQLAVSKYSKAPKEAAELASYLASKELQKKRAIEQSMLPTLPSLYDDKEIASKMPFIPDLLDVFNNAVPRPTTPTKSKYNQVSNAFATAVYNVLTKKQTAQTSLKNLETQLVRIKGRNW